MDVSNNNGHDFLIFAVKDELTGKFHQPMYFESDEEAKRWFEYVLNNTDMWKENASEFALYRLGMFNDKTGLGDYPLMELVQGGLGVLKKGE